MNNSKKSMVSLALCIAVLLGLLATVPSIAVENKNDEYNLVNGRIIANISYTPEETPIVVEWLNSSFQLALIDLQCKIVNSNCPITLSYLNIAYENTKNKNAEDMLVIFEDGSSILTQYLPFIDIGFTDSRNATVSNQNGEFSIVDQLLSSDYSNIKISFEGHDIVYSDILINNDGNIEIIINKTLKDFSDAFIRMGAEVQTQSFYLPTYFYSSPITYPTPKNTTFQSSFYTSTGIVGCNKCGTTLSAATFPLNNADCAVSIALGKLYIDDPNLFSAYEMSLYCYIEAFTPGYANLYCNGASKSGRYNCSWFTGIGHDERLHTHDGSNTIYS